MVMVERDGETMLIDHEESFKTHHKTFPLNKINYNLSTKHWVNEETGNSFFIDVSDQFESPAKAIFGTNPGDTKINA